MRRRWIILTVFTVLVVTVLLGSLAQTPIYRGTTTLMIERKSPSVISDVQGVSNVGADYNAYRDYYETQYKLIKSQSTLKKVADLVGLKSDDEHPVESQIQYLEEIVSVFPIKDSQLVEIRVENENPQMAALIANTCASVYIRNNLERSLDTTGDAAKWISKILDEQKQKLNDSETALQEYRKKNNLDVLPKMTDQSADEDIKREYARLRALLANYNERYTDKHPEVVELKSQIHALRNKIYGLEDSGAGDKTMKYRALEKEAQTNKHMYELLLSRLKEIEISSTLEANNISIIDEAGVPEKPVKPNILRNMLLAVILGLAMGVGAGFFVEYLDTTIKLPQDVKDILGLNFLGSIPEIAESDEIKRNKIVYLQPIDPASEAYRGIRTEIDFLTFRNKGPKTILITSAEPKAGKTTSVLNMAITFAQAHKGNKILIVDCDLRKPKIHKTFNLDKDNGLGEYLKTDVTVDRIIKDTEIENLHVITAGKSIPDPAEAIGSERMEEFISEVKQRFDVIIFDSSPVVSVTDAVILANIVDEVIQVVRSGKANIPVELRAKEKLANTNTNILGAVLNGVNLFQSDYYRYRYYGEDKG